jgi:hypothetical protein
MEAASVPAVTAMDATRFVGRKHGLTVMTVLALGSVRRVTAPGRYITPDDWGLDYE